VRSLLTGVGFPAVAERVAAALPAVAPRGAFPTGPAVDQRAALPDGMAVAPSAAFSSGPAVAQGSTFFAGPALAFLAELYQKGAADFSSDRVLRTTSVVRDELCQAILARLGLVVNPKTSSGNVRRQPHCEIGLKRGFDCRGVVRGPGPWCPS